MNLKDRRLLELLDRRSLDQTVEPNSSVLLAVSGGADSVALLRAMTLYAPVRSIQLAVVHVNHGLRPESDDEARFVQELSKELGLACHYTKLALGSKRKGTSPEEFWREERYKVFAATLKGTGAAYLALGQTADDLAESFLFHLTRGTGPEGLAFHFLKYAQSGDLPVVRPLWKTRRSAIEAALKGVEQRWLTDPSNVDLQYSRNRIRAEVIPALEKINPAAVTAIVNLADKLTECTIGKLSSPREQALHLEITRTLRGGQYKALCGALRTFLSADLAVQHTAKHIEQAADMIKESNSGIVALPNSNSLVITQTAVWLYDGADPNNKDLAKEHIRRFGGFCAELGDRKCAQSDQKFEILGFDGSRYEVAVEDHDSIIIRNRKPGDRIGPRTLKKLLVDYEVAWYLRDYLVLASTPDHQVVSIITDNKSLAAWIKSHAIAPCTLQYSKITP